MWIQDAGRERAENGLMSPLRSDQIVWIMLAVAALLVVMLLYMLAR